MPPRGLRRRLQGPVSVVGGFFGRRRQPEEVEAANQVEPRERLFWFGQAELQRGPHIGQGVSEPL